KDLTLKINNACKDKLMITTAKESDDRGRSTFVGYSFGITIPLAEFIDKCIKTERDTEISIPSFNLDDKELLGENYKQTDFQIAFFDHYTENNKSSLGVNQTSCVSFKPIFQGRDNWLFSS